jgi:DNA polymerase-3 subunit epsilon
VDLETTGLDATRDEVIAFAVVPVDAGRIRAGAVTYRLVRPQRMPQADSIRIHGIRPADLAEAPPLEAQRDVLLEALAGRLPVAHAAQVERAFLAPVLAEAGVTLRGPVADTRELGRAWLAEAEPGTVAPRLELGALARRLGLPVHRPHHALGDALTTAQVFLALATRLERRGRLTVRSLIAAQEHAGHQRG